MASGTWKTRPFIETVSVPQTQIAANGYADITFSDYTVKNPDSFFVVPKTGYGYLANFWLDGNGKLKITLVNFLSSAITTDPWSEIMVIYL